MNSTPCQSDETSAEPAGRATYCPEDNKLRLYVGRVPRDEYLKLRAEGWTALHKQREAGGGDFVATWTPERRDTALDYAGVIEDEDMGPAERAADRAERFAGYREKRTGEAAGRADTFDAGPAVHGFQSQARAERAAMRHDRVAARACDAWSKAEYWQRRTAGVISHALHVCSPSVRMGRIKELEADLRRHAASGREDDWTTHYRLRLAYENQMIEAQGGRAASLEIEAGGKWGGLLIVKVNKSTATGRVTSVLCKGPKVHGYRYMTQDVIGFDYSLHQFDTERESISRYTPPTDETRAEVEALKQARKAATKAAKPPCPLVNPTDSDAERLQTLFNANPRFRGDKPSQVARMTQAEFSARIGGSCDTMIICETGLPHRTNYGENVTRSDVYKVRACGGGYTQCQRVVVLTDKPQKEIPWAAVEAARAKHPTVDSIRPRFAELAEQVNAGWRNEYSQLLLDARYVGLVSILSLSQVSWTDAGRAEWAAFKAAQPVTA